MLNIVSGFWVFLWDLLLGHVLGQKIVEKFCLWKWLWDRRLVKRGEKSLKKVAEKFGLWGNLVVPLQPQTGNGGSRAAGGRPRRLQGREKVVTFARPTRTKSGEDIEMMLQTI